MALQLLKKDYTYFLDYGQKNHNYKQPSAVNTTQKTPRFMLSVLFVYSFFLHINLRK